MDEPHNIEQKKPDTKEYILWDPTYIEYQSRQNSTLMLGVRMMVTLEDGVIIVTRKKHKKSFLDAGWTCMLSANSHWALHLIYTTFHMHVILQ